MTQKDWESAKVTISRGDLANIFSAEMNKVVRAAHIAGGHKFAEQIEDLLVEYSAKVGATVFADFVDEDLIDDDEEAE